MQKTKKLKQVFPFLLILAGLGLLVFQFIGIAKASPAAPSPGHTWADLECDTNLCVDTTNHRVGIGETTPTQALDVDGSVKVSGDVRADGNISANKWKGCKKVYPSQDGCPTGFYPVALIETGATNVWPSSIPNDKTVVCCGNVITLLYDDFEDASIDTTKWQPAPNAATSGDWTETGGYLQARVTGANWWRAWGVATKNPVTIGTGDMTWMINRTYIDGNFGNFFLADTYGAKWNYDYATQPQWGFGFPRGDHGDNLVKIIDGTATNLENFSAYGTTLGVFEIKKIGNVFSVWLNGSKISGEYSIPELEGKSLYMVWDVCRTNNSSLFTVRVSEAGIFTTSY